jgi:hypothetical protein
MLALVSGTNGQPLVPFRPSLPTKDPRRLGRGHPRCHCRLTRKRIRQQRRADLQSTQFDPENWQWVDPLPENSPLRPAISRPVDQITGAHDSRIQARAPYAGRHIEMLHQGQNRTREQIAQLIYVDAFVGTTVRRRWICSRLKHAADSWLNPVERPVSVVNEIATGERTVAKQLDLHICAASELAPVRTVHVNKRVAPALLPANGVFGNGWSEEYAAA